MTRYHIKEEDQIEIASDTDHYLAISSARSMTARAGFDETAQHLIGTAVSELATNLVRYGGGGELWLRWLAGNGTIGFEVEAQDQGPGIPDIEAALSDNFSTGRSLGLGLPGVKRIMDEFTIESTPGKGTRCVARKWR